MAEEIKERKASAAFEKFETLHEMDV